MNASSSEKQADVLARPVWPEESPLTGFRGFWTSLEAVRGSIGDSDNVSTDSSFCNVSKSMQVSCRALYFMLLYDLNRLLCKGKRGEQGEAQFRFD